MPDQIYGVTWNGKEKVKYTYDGLGRLNNKQILVGGDDLGAPKLDNIYTYEDVNNTKTTTLVKSVKTAAGTYTYTYDKLGNIISINDGTYTTSYAYDNLNQLVRVNNERVGKTYTYAYTNGNITECNEYAYTTEELGEVLNTVNWAYGDSTWADLLTNYNGEAITYDEIGNPLTIGTKSLSWDGRQLCFINDSAGDSHGLENKICYEYDGNGNRYLKVVGTKLTQFYYNGEILAGQKNGNGKIVFMYDNNGDIFGFNLNGTDYYYIKNAQNDVTAITDSTGKVIANYYYDSWGKCIEVTGNTEIAEINPIRYRSYYYDNETGWYYLKTRYYSPEMCRFINADSYAQTGQGMLDKNMFAYCENNPINAHDPDGTCKHRLYLWDCGKCKAKKALEESSALGKSIVVVEELYDNSKKYNEASQNARKDYVTHIENTVNYRSKSKSKPAQKSYNNPKLNKKLKANSRYSRYGYDGIRTVALSLGYNLENMTWKDVQEHPDLEKEILNTYVIWDNASPETIAKVYGEEYGVGLAIETFLP